MPIGLINVYSTRNLGDAAILTALSDMSPDHRALARVPDAAPLPIRGLGAVAALPDVAAYVSVGGDIFNNGRPAFITRQFLANIAELLRQPKRTFVFGQSVPRSCRGMAFRLLVQAYKRLAGVMVRDGESHRRLTDAGAKVELGYDAAFALAPHANAAEQGRLRLAAAGIDADRAALLSLRGFDHMYPTNQPLFLARMAMLVTALRRRGHQPVLLVQSDAVGADSDRGLAREIARIAGPVDILDLVEPLKGDPVAALIEVLAAAEIVVAVRYHTAILRLITGRVPVVVSYSNKTRDLCDRLGMPGSDLSRFDVPETVAMAEAAAKRRFDPAPIRATVRQQFDASLALAKAA